MNMRELGDPVFKQSVVRLRAATLLAPVKTLEEEAGPEVIGILGSGVKETHPG